MAWRVQKVFEADPFSAALLKDYRTGVLGPISLETPETRKAMLAEQLLAKVKVGNEEA